MKKETKKRVMYVGAAAAVVGVGGLILYFATKKDDKSQGASTGIPPVKGPDTGTPTPTPAPPSGANLWQVVTVPFGLEPNETYRVSFSSLDPGADAAARFFRSLVDVKEFNVGGPPVDWPADDREVTGGRFRFEFQFKGPSRTALPAPTATPPSLKMWRLKTEKLVQIGPHLVRIGDLIGPKYVVQGTL